MAAKTALSYYQQQFFSYQNPQNKLLHFNNAGLAPICLPAKERIQYWGHRFYEEGFFTDHDYMQDIQNTRQRLAQLIGCESTEVAFFQNASAAISQVAFSMGLQPTDEVVMWEQEFSSNMYPWQEACRQSGAKLILVPTPSDYSTPYETLLQSCTARTKVIAISWVQFQTGEMTDLKKLIELAHQKNIFVMVDAIQGLGLHECDFKSWNIDALVGGSHKWLTSAVGVGFLALRQDYISKMIPRAIGSMTYGTCDDPAMLGCIPKRDATKFENSSKQVLEITALGAALELILKTGVDVIRGEACRLAHILSKELLQKNFVLHSQLESPIPIVNFSNTKFSNQELKNKLSTIHANCALRGPGVRLSPHAFNNETEIQKILSVL